MEKYHNVGTIPKSKIKIVKRNKIDSPNSNNNNNNNNDYFTQEP